MAIMEGKLALGLGLGYGKVKVSVRRLRVSRSPFCFFISFLFANSIFIYSVFAYRKIRKVQIGACLESRLQDLTRVLVSAII